MLFPLIWLFLHCKCPLCFELMLLVRRVHLFLQQINSFSPNFCVSVQDGIHHVHHVEQRFVADIVKEQRLSWSFRFSVDESLVEKDGVPANRLVVFLNVFVLLFDYPNGFAAQPVPFEVEFEVFFVLLAKHRFFLLLQLLEYFF